MGGGEEKEKQQFTGIFRMDRMTATENAEGHGGRFASVVGNTSGSGWYRAFRSELLAAEYPSDPATSSLAERQGRGEKRRMRIRRRGTRRERTTIGCCRIIVELRCDASLNRSVDRLGMRMRVGGGK